MWLPQIYYESVPFSLLGSGAVGLGAAFFIEAWYWPEILAGGGFLAVVSGLVLLLKRRGYRSSRSRRDFEDLV